MAGQIDRRAALAMAGLGALGLTAALGRGVSAAPSSAAGIVAGGSLAGTGGDITFSAFGSRIEDDTVTEPTLIGALAWHDPAGLDGGSVTLTLVHLASYGPGEVDDTRVLTGTVSVNGDGEVPFSLTLVDAGLIGEVVDSVHLTVGPDVAGEGWTVAPTIDFAYEASGELTAGDIQIINLSL